MKAGVGIDLRLGLSLDQQPTPVPEAALLRNDPGLARRMRQGRGAGGRGRRVSATAVTVVLVVGLLWLGLPGQALLVVMVGLGFLLALGWWPAVWIEAITRRIDEGPTQR